MLERVNFQRFLITKHSLCSLAVAAPGMDDVPFPHQPSGALRKKRRRSHHDGGCQQLYSERNQICCLVVSLGAGKDDAARHDKPDDLHLLVHVDGRATRGISGRFGQVDRDDVRCKTHDHGSHSFANHKLAEPRSASDDTGQLQNNSTKTCTRGAPELTHASSALALDFCIPPIRRACQGLHLCRLLQGRSQLVACSRVRRAALPQGVPGIVKGPDWHCTGRNYPS